MNCPDFHKLINEFYKLTNVPALLNTSFNLHGNPVVHDLKDAIKTFDNCELKFLLINDFLIKKKKVIRYLNNESNFNWKSQNEFSFS